jgi:hypothetical protein
MKKLTYIALAVSHITTATTLDVYVYHSTGVPDSVLAEAHSVLARILRVSGIELRWRPGPAASPEALRVVIPEPARPGRERELVCAARRDVAVLIVGDVGAAPTPTAFGYANPLAPEGVNATILYRRVTKVAAEHGVPIGTLLAHAIAHEIGHVLLRSSSHTKNGLMAGGWDNAQFQRVRHGELFFKRDEAERMEASITGKGCTDVTALSVATEPDHAGPEIFAGHAPIPHRHLR